MQHCYLTQPAGSCMWSAFYAPQVTINTHTGDTRRWGEDLHGWGCTAHGTRTLQRPTGFDANLDGPERVIPQNKAA